MPPRPERYEVSRKTDRDGAPTSLATVVGGSGSQISMTRVTLVVLLAVCLQPWASAAAPSNQQHRIALVHQMPFHLEVLAGLLDVLKVHGNDAYVYIHEDAMPGQHREFGMFSWCNDFFGSIHALPQADEFQDKKFDVMLFTNPQYDLGYAQEVIQATSPRTVIMFIHDAAWQELHKVVQLQQYGSYRLHVLALSPHVARQLSSKLGVEVEWVLPLRKLAPRVPCDADNLNTCLAGFALQGLLTAHKAHGYKKLWSQLAKRYRHSHVLQMDDRLFVNVYGSGLKRGLTPPNAIAHLVNWKTNLTYEDFYNEIYHHLALVASFHDDTYYTTQFSSYVLTSLLTGVPLIAERQLLDAYSFLDEDVVHVIRPGEDVVHVITRVLALGPQELLQQRAALLRLRDQMAEANVQLLSSFITGEEAVARRAGAGAAAVAASGRAAAGGQRAFARQRLRRRLRRQR